MDAGFSGIRLFAGGDENFSGAPVSFCLSSRAFQKFKLTSLRQGFRSGPNCHSPDGQRTRITSRAAVKYSNASSSTSTPSPGFDGTLMVPSELRITGGSIRKMGSENGVRLRYFFIFLLRPSTRFFSNSMSFSLNPSSSRIRLSTFAMPWHNETGSRRKKSAILFKG